MFSGIFVIAIIALLCTGRTLPLLCLCASPTQWQWRPKVQNYVEGVVSEFDEMGMLRTFRLTELAVEIVLGLLKAAKQKRQTNYARGRPAVDLRKQVFILLNYMCTQSTAYQIAQIFGVSVFVSASDIWLTFCMNTTSHFSSKAIWWQDAASCSGI